MWYTNDSWYVSIVLCSYEFEFTVTFKTSEEEKKQRTKSSTQGKMATK